MSLYFCFTYQKSIFAARDSVHQLKPDIYWSTWEIINLYYILSSKQLHAKQCKDHNEEEEEEEQADDGLHGVQQRHN